MNKQITEEIFFGFTVFYNLIRLMMQSSQDKFIIYILAQRLIISLVNMQKNLPDLFYSQVFRIDAELICYQ